MTIKRILGISAVLLLAIIAYLFFDISIDCVNDFFERVMGLLVHFFDISNLWLVSFCLGPKGI